MEASPPTPLSDSIDAAKRGGPQAYERFLQVFVGAEVGVRSSQGPGGESLVTFGSHPEVGSKVLLVFADPPAFAARFGAPFNSGMKGEGALKTVAANPECQGVLVNSATSRESIVIRRDVALRLLGGAKKPWWRFW